MIEEKEAKYLAYIKSKSPHITINKIDYNFMDGKHNDIVVINDAVVFKFARYDWSACFVDNEVRIANLVKHNVNMPLPKFTPVEKGVAFCNFIEGIPMYRNEILLLENRVQDRIAAQVGVFLKQMHSIPLIKVRESRIDDIPEIFTYEYWMTQFDEIQKKVFPYCGSYSQEYIRQIFKPVLENERFFEFNPVLIHGEPAPYHFRFDKNAKRIKGVIGFGLSGPGDPAYDLGVLLDNMGEDFIRRMSAYYAAIPSLIERARFYAYVNQVCYCKNVADMITTRDFTHFRFNFKDRDVMPIGSGW